ncbi:hypothetical protein LPTSP2_36240 [Leptospira ellinghausenii]|uniref:Segregation and condensation protein A n=1 Tax=Leptospira ellinghausenii TaxID=1917822 RepID=A0A2P2DI80_9LEPT|nr:ABC-three component system middle component 8 [Leptospira ellinghausenii]GBF44321.1 hypothetical protein LPTSP2_36240 [Leptospira ellinghausenii]
MIKPHKYLNLDLSILNISAFILQDLKKNSILSYNDVINSSINKFGENVKDTIPFALSFLFMLDKIEYLGNELDAFQLKGYLIETQ